MDSKHVVVVDMGGVMYSFSHQFNQIEHEQAFNANVKWHGGKISELQSEFLGVKKFFSGEIGAGVLPVYFVSKAFLVLSENAKKFQIVVASTSLVETSRLILERGFSSVGVASSTVDSFAIYNMAEFGSKKESKSWEKILRRYRDIDVIIDDSDINLQAAGKAVQKLGRNTQLLSSMDAFRPRT